ncbi:hypothetical protein, partial [Mesorhizobium sp. M7A.F.Ca.CA.001.08.2.1]|uniref:hypothetical protein n=2 Tax=unclassified Mesorhizobium TaxID=325217 RepID=UPI0013E3E21D
MNAISHASIHGQVGTIIFWVTVTTPTSWSQGEPNDETYSYGHNGNSALRDLSRRVFFPPDCRSVAVRRAGEIGRRPDAGNARARQNYWMMRGDGGIAIVNYADLRLL